MDGPGYNECLPPAEPLVAAWPQYWRGQRYIEELTDPQGLKVLIMRPYKHPSCRWAKASKPMTSKAAKTLSATRFFIMAATPRRRRTSHDAEADFPSLCHAASPQRI
jgi:hypothetical protein